MSGPIIPKTPTTNAGSSPTHTSDRAKTTTPTTDLTDRKENLHDFRDKISTAKLAGEEWVETTPEIINYYNRKGLNGAKFFIYEGVKVCEHGTDIEALEKEMDTPLALKKHGALEGVVIGNPN